MPAGETRSLQIYGLGGFLIVFFISAALVSEALWGWLVFIPLAVLLAVGLACHYRLESSEHEYRLFTLAQANGLVYEPRETGPPLPGMIFRHGFARKASRRMYSEGAPQFVEFGNYEAVTGSGKTSTRHRWGYIAIRLNAPAPHIVLDAKRTRSLDSSGLPRFMSAEHRVPLSPEFEEDFTLYTMEAHQDEARKLFSPQLFQRLQASAGRFDIEVVEEWLFVYSPEHIVSPDLKIWSWVSPLTSQLMEAAARWRSGPQKPAETLPVTSEPGQRLSSSRFSARKLLLTVGLLALSMVITVLVNG